ncbi:hypothetical protein [Cupriavidus basilensis]|uniref:hypothetical protein n=1 Tax=Cupriavidus basilensis TaxID=68895 RepID=UPI00157B3908|nr:hypothetical protein [Cupriavidus basilensis]NUA29571.1 hypothetical protein [Cupriavidus basilensis]
MPDSRKRRRLLQAAAAAPLLWLAGANRANERIDNVAEREVRVIGPWELSSLCPLRNGYRFARLQRSPAVHVCSVTIPRTTSLKLNARHPLLADPQVRRALSLALDRRGIATAIPRDPSLAAGQLFGSP